MILGSRSARFAGLALALTMPVVAAYAAPAFAAGESTTAVLTSPTSGSATTFTWDYTFHQNGGHGLSNVAIRFCSAAILADVASAGPSAEIFASGDVPGGHTGFGPGIKFGVTATMGTLTVTFNNPHPVSESGLEIQSHSGDNQIGDTVMTGKGPGSCSGDSTAIDEDIDEDIAEDIEEDVDEDNGGGDDPGGGSGGGNNGGDGGGNSNAPTTNTNSTPAPVKVLPVAVEKSNTPASKTAVLGETFVAPAELPRTGTGHLRPLLALACSLIAAGTGLRAVSSRRVRSASFPG